MTNKEKKYLFKKKNRPFYLLPVARFLTSFDGNFIKKFRNSIEKNFSDYCTCGKNDQYTK